MKFLVPPTGHALLSGVRFMMKSAAYLCCNHRHINAHVGKRVDLKAGAAVAVVICCHRCLVVLAFETVPLRHA